MPSTFVAFMIASAPISTARSAPAVSVVKNGLPVPAAKITTRPFSRCRMARRRMYGSATARISIAESSRVCRSAFSRASRSGGAREVVAAADDDRELDAERDDVLDLDRDPVEHRRIDPVAPVPGEGLAGELQDDAAARVTGAAVLL